MMPPGLEWVTVNRASDYAAHVGAVAGLFEAAFRRDFPRDVWDQYYFANPYGDPIVSLAYSGSTLAAHQALGPCVASHHDATVAYRLSISTMVHPAHRSMPVFVALFENVHREAQRQEAGFILGFPNANLHVPLKRCFRYQTVVESPLLNWTPPKTDPASVVPDPAFGRPAAGTMSLPATPEFWSWRTRFNQARAVVANGRFRVTYTLLPGGTLNVLSLDPTEQATPLDLAGLAAAECCREVRITGHHASALGIPEAELTSHENYCVRMTAKPLGQAPPPMQFNLLFCDIF